MPIYEYRCADCGHLYEEFVRFGDDPELKCPVCGCMEAGKAFSLFATGGASVGSSSASAGADCAPSGG